MPSRPNEIGSKSRPRPTDGKKISKASNGVSQALWRGILIGLSNAIRIREMYGGGSSG